MAPPPLVSCIVCVHDGERYLSEALDSIVAQDHPSLEVVVVDDGSTDSTAAIAESYGDRVRVHRQDQQGIAAARNHGIRVADGDYLCFLDADDVYRPGKVRRQLEQFAATPALEVSLCRSENFWEPGLEAEEARYRAHDKVKLTHTFDNLMVRRGVFDRVGLLDTWRGGAGEVEWFVRLAEADVVMALIPEVLVSRRMHAASFSHTVEVLDPIVDVFKELLDRRRGRAGAGAATREAR